jgi:hypothetical protein
MTRFAQYLAALASANNLEDGIEWLFYPGMLPESNRKWWGDFTNRHAAHEGIDICFYKNRNKKIRSLGPGAAIPAWSAGTVVNVCEDFLGRTLVVEPKNFSGTATRVVEVFSHLDPCEGIAIGTRVAAGRIIARTSDTRARGSVLLPHLHLSCIEVLQQMPVQSLDWSLFPFREKVNLLNPVFM